MLSFDYNRENSNIIHLTEIKIQEFQHTITHLKMPFLLESIHTYNSKIHSAYKLAGNGKIASTVASNTYELILNGNISNYQKFWTSILNTISKKDFQLSDWEPVSKIAIIDQPFIFKLRSDIENPIVKDRERGIISLQEDIAINGLWYGRTYPKSLGWHRMRLEHDSSSTYSYYAMHNDNFKTLRAYNNSN